MSDKNASSSNLKSETFTIEVPLKSLQPGLYLISTPIGNLEDITLRALNVLRMVHVVACEDTRVLRKLLGHYGIKVQTALYHDHNADQQIPKIIERIQNGEAVGLVSDAGTPMVSDPGYKLVRECINAGVMVTAIPGATAAITGLSLSGMPTDQFLFAGFMPTKKGQMKKKMEEIKATPSSKVFYESPRRLVRFFEAALDVFGDCDAAVARELTKMFEEVRRGKISELLEQYKNEDAPKGEAVIIIGPGAVQSEWSNEDVIDALKKSMASSSLKDSVKQVTNLTGWKKKEIYQMALDIASEEG